MTHKQKNKAVSRNLWVGQMLDSEDKAAFINMFKELKEIML